MVFNTEFLAFIQSLKLFSLQTKRDSDFTDRINHHFTAMILIVTSILISSSQYVGNPINCWVPNEFSDQWQTYANNYCWIKNTYWIPKQYDDNLPKLEDRQQLEINYYQWVPIVLLCQALLFYFPAILWRMMNWTIGINIQDIVSKSMNVCSTIRTNEQESKQETVDEKKELSEEEIEAKYLKVPAVVKDIAHHLEFSIDSVSESKNSFITFLRTICIFSFGSRKFGFYLTTLYFLTKLLYIINIIGQFFILNEFIGSSYKFFGIQALRDLVNGNDWQNTGHFPRITMCDFEIRTLGQRRNYTVQCVLAINLFNEKIYIFIWFWFIFVAILTIYSFFHWICRMLSFQKIKFIKGLLKKRVSSWNKIDGDLLKILVNNRLKSDGILLIYLIYLNAGDIVTKELMDVLWYRHKRRYQDKIKENVLNESEYDDNMYML